MDERVRDSSLPFRPATASRSDSTPPNESTKPHFVPCLVHINLEVTAFLENQRLNANNGSEVFWTSPDEPEPKLLIEEPDCNDPPDELYDYGPLRPHEKPGDRFKKRLKYLPNYECREVYVKKN